MLEYIQSAEFQQLLADNPIILFLVAIMACMTLICCFAFFPRWFTVTTTHHHHHYPPAPSATQQPNPFVGSKATQQGHPFQNVKPGYYYLDDHGHVYSLPTAPQQSDESIFDDIFSEQMEPSEYIPPVPVRQSARRKKNRLKMSSSKRFNIMRRDSFRCRLCGRGPDDVEGLELQVDHKMPAAAGGTNDDDNLWTLCSECNRGKSDIIMDELFSDPSGKEEAEIPSETDGDK